MRNNLLEYTLRLGDDALILGQRLSAWCGHAPSLEVDLGLSSLALDLIGQATEFLELAAKIDGKGQDADALAFRRDPPEYRNCLLVEQPNGDFAQTLARQFLFSNWQLLVLDALAGSADPQLAAIARKAHHEVESHVEFARTWMVKLGDHACVNHQRLVKSLDQMVRYVDELFQMDEVDDELLARGIAVDKAALRHEYEAQINAVLSEAGLAHPRPKGAVAMNGRRGHHSEHLAHMLADMHLPQRPTPRA
jgi:ring-1,2-phenylacetyl-CoA epoxidase subunit PaaC